MSMLNKIKQNLINIPGWKTNSRIVIFESDDWGSIRMPSRDAYNSLIKQGIRVDKSVYDSNDCLENKTDFTYLIELLNNFKDSKEHPPVFTLNTVMANPDFDKIKKNDFKEYFYISFLDSYKYYNNEEMDDVWSTGIAQKLIKPQFHAREHLNSLLWLKDLRLGNKDTLKAFDNHFFGLKTKTSSVYQKNYLAAYWPESKKELEQIKKNTEVGLGLFEKTFGYRSRTMVPCNFIWPEELEPFLKELGIDLIQSQRGHISPQPFKNGKPKVRRHYTGKKNQHDQIYTVRNVFFEPYLHPDKNIVRQVLKEIENAFFWGKPAIISTHRINYVSGMNKKLKDNTLKQLSLLLSELLRNWPELVFMTSDELIKEIRI